MNSAKISEKLLMDSLTFLLLDDKGFPLVVLEAKSDDKNPLVGKKNKLVDMPKV